MLLLLALVEKYSIVQYWFKIGNIPEVYGPWQGLCSLW